MVVWFIAIQAILETILIIIFIVKRYQNQNQIRLIPKLSRSFSGPLGGWPGRILPILPFFQPLADEDEAQSVKEFFLKSLQEYREKVVSLNDRKNINAMKAMTRALKKVNEMQS